MTIPTPTTKVKRIALIILAAIIAAVVIYLDATAIAQNAGISQHDRCVQSEMNGPPPMSRNAAEVACVNLETGRG